ncbi:hypothetical protein F4777DRAFT_96925 [Nemania sp. FL0916]|nr:hypothetical protein F4777DRAFT_96925 [Nemania sp. FL0916]
MPLKRGLERQSCEFCFRRKIKCDRSARAATGHLTCSQCDLRQTSCTFDPDDVRIQRRRKKSSPGAKLPNTSRGVDTLPETTTQRHICNVLARNNDLAHPNIMNNSALDHDNTLRLSFSDTTPISISDSTAIATIAESQTVDSMIPNYPDYNFELSSESISFLDSIFLQGHDTLGPSGTWDGIPTPAPEVAHEPLNTLITANNPYCSSDIQSDILDAAVDAYFHFASLALPMLSKDGFMVDYNSCLSSPALVFAVACRGCAFMKTTDKFMLQKQFASRFRETFLQARGIASNRCIVRLDDLEALALMVDPGYQNSEDTDSPLELQLQNLLLTHDSLVLMTLQYRIETHVSSPAGVSTSLSRATQRQTNLFWYVYGCDAFFSLDRKVASRIRDEDIDPSRQIYEHESQSYFDAILSLAGIARKMVRLLCSPVTRRKGVKYQDVENIYKQLEEWHTNICPRALQIQLSSTMNSQQEGPSSLGLEMKQYSPLHKAIATLLELNCYMQLEAYVEEYGIEDHGSLTGQIADMRVKYETLRAAHKIVEVARWIEKMSASQMASASKPAYLLPDLSPGIIRNICAGASNWISQKAKELPHPAMNMISDPAAKSPGYLNGEGDSVGFSPEQVTSWTESLATLRNVAYK